MICRCKINDSVSKYNQEPKVELFVPVFARLPYDVNFKSHMKLKLSLLSVPSSAPPSERKVIRIRIIIFSSQAGETIFNRLTTGMITLQLHSFFVIHIIYRYQISAIIINAWEMGILRIQGSCSSSQFPLIMSSNQWKHIARLMLGQ